MSVKDCADLMIEVSRLARQLQETRTIVQMLREDVEGLRNDLGREKQTIAELMAAAILDGERDDRSKQD